MDNKNDNIGINTRADQSFFSISLISPAANSSFTGPSSGVVVSILGKSDDPDKAIQKIEVVIGNGPLIQAKQTTSGDWSNWSASYTVATPGQQTITARATSNQHVIKTAKINITVSFAPTTGDTIAPTISITSPSNGAIISRPPSVDNKVIVNVTGTALDNLGGSGLQQIETRFGENRYTLATQIKAGDWSNWSASYTVATPGQQTITARATDKAGNAKEISININVLFLTLNYALKNRNFNPVGHTVKLVGSGFLPGVSVLANDQEMPNVHFIDQNNIEFDMIRPARINTDTYGGGESVLIHVRLPDGTISQQVTIMLNSIVMAVFGDSVQWGQGLREEEKFHSMVLDYIKDTLSRSSAGDIRIYKIPYMGRSIHAHSGAIIGLDDSSTIHQAEESMPGEIPRSYPTIYQQVDTFKEGPREAVDLIMLNGGINDVGIFNILNPFSSTKEIQANTRRFCYDHMKILLRHLKTIFKNPETKIVVTGYYRIISEDTDVVFFPLLAALLSGLLGVVEGLIITVFIAHDIISNCKAFADMANTSLQQAVDDVNADDANKRIVFVEPEFGSENAIFAPKSWLWGLGGNLKNLLAEDSVAEERRNQCVPYNKNIPHCRWASMGHPNIQGARMYAAAITPKLYGLFLPPPRRISVRVVPYPIVFGKTPSSPASMSSSNQSVTVNLTVYAEDSQSHNPVLGRVLIDGKDIANTNIQFTYTFTKKMRRVFDSDIRKSVMEPIYPSGIVAAPGYDNADIDFGFE